MYARGDDSGVPPSGGGQLRRGDRRVRARRRLDVRILPKEFRALGDRMRMAHQSGGVLFLRVEDTDAKREVPGAVEVLISSLKHYNIHFDEGATIDGDNGAYGPYRQRQRAEIYHVYAKKLVMEGKAYPCFCTEEELHES